MSASGIEAIIFDLHGVLCDGEDWHEEAFNKAMFDFGYEVTPDLFRKGFTTRMRLKRLSKIGKAPSNYKGIIEKKSQYIMEIIEEKCKPIQRVTDAVQFAYSYTVGRMAVATNSSEESAYYMLERAGLKDFFNTIITNKDVGDKVKPHPLPYLLAAYQLGVSSRNCLAVDNSDIGIMSAIDAMCKTMRVSKFDILTAGLLESQLKSLEIRV